MKILRRPKNCDVREREHLIPKEIDSLIKAAKRLGRHGERDATLILLAFRHGLRVSELLALRWSQIDFDNQVLHVIRLKGGINSTHPLTGNELRALRQLKRDYPSENFLFLTERKTPMTAHTFRKLLTRAGKAAKLPVSVHPHMLRHSTGYALVNKGVDLRRIQYYLGHKNIQHTTRYTTLDPNQFQGLWHD